MIRSSLAFLLAAALTAPASAAPHGSAELGALYDGSRARSTGLDGLAVSTAAASRSVTAAGAVAAPESLDSWLARERAVALTKMEANISPAGSAPGAVAASPSHKDPDYFFHWRRDAALTMQEVVTLYAQSKDPGEKQAYLRMLTDYADFVKKTQAQSTLTGLGEPKFNMDGSPFNGPWGRPQDDAPAEEASTLIYFASVVLKEGNKDLAKSLYGGFADGAKGDLEYVSHHWGQTSFDVWEEVKAHHFDTETAQRTALLEGAWLADQLGDDGAPGWYRAQAELLKTRMAKHWDPGKGYIVSALDQDAGLGGKDSGLDSAVILAAIHRRPVDGEIIPAGDASFFSVTDARVLATAQALKDRFKAEYAVNRRPGEPGVAIGRYPEDSYFGGNPWPLLTAAFAQLDYMAAAEYRRRGEIQIEAADEAFFRALVPGRANELNAGTALMGTEPLFAEVMDALRRDGDSYLSEVRAHANPDGSLSEQIEKNSGVMTSAKDLTWNYASILSALQARDALGAGLTASRRN
ncbi:MAG: glycoside hydrolase family 15 protein [Elusimicrobia bacterium]|nr:glycoside hydrolase family 15 protein [Elusimicrobiota bacterium]